MFQINNTVTCQFGNPGERGYRPNQQAVIIAARESFPGFNIFLVKQVGREDFLGAAVVTSEELAADGVQGQLYCTDGRSFGPGTAGERFGFLTEADARRSLGF